VCDTIKEFMHHGVIVRKVIHGLEFNGSAKDAMTYGRPDNPYRRHQTTPASSSRRFGTSRRCQTPVMTFEGLRQIVLQAPTMMDVNEKLRLCSLLMELPPERITKSGRRFVKPSTFYSFLTRKRFRCGQQ
jgi:hypothetical protein